MSPSPTPGWAPRGRRTSSRWSPSATRERTGAACRRPSASCWSSAASATAATSPPASGAIDSLLNYETVKYFGDEAHEAARFDEAERDYEEAAIRSAALLSLLTIGQAAIIAAGSIAVMIMAGAASPAGTMTVGDFVLVNAYLLQLYAPLGLLGMVYREHASSR